jgi:exopolyphosphatase / guanosine-5'-triphosphate,3'-diphosphate pyrophosphatase
VRSPRHRVRRAAIDIGTNSVRLLIADVDDRAGTGGPRVRVVDRALEITRLGEGLHAGGMLTSESASRTAAVVERYVSRARSLGVASPVVAGTYALRAARNPDQLLSRLGVPVRVLGGDEEAALGFRGAVEGLQSLDRSAPALVLDVGGGSVELTWGTADRGMEDSRSLPVGCVVMTQRFIAHDPPSSDELAALDGAIVAALDPALAPLRQNLRPRRHLVGVGGTVTTLAAMAQRLVPYDPERVHGFGVTMPDVERLLTEMRAVPLSARRRLPGLQRERADVIIAGALVVHHVLASLGHDAITASETDLLWALVAGPPNAEKL